MKASKVLRIALGVLFFAGLVLFCIPISMGFRNIGCFVGGFACLVLFLAAVFFPVLQRFYRKNKQTPWKKWTQTVVLTIVVLGVAWTGFLTGCMIFGATHTAPAGCTVVVLGSKVNGTEPSAVMWSRIRTAADYLDANPEAMVMASGGQGEDEDISEAEAIKRGLVSLGIAESRILLEDQSVDTKQNLAFTQKILEENGLSSEIVISTDEYHQFRASQIAQRLGMTAYALPAPSPWFLFAPNCVRELLALTKFFVLP